MYSLFKHQQTILEKLRQFCSFAVFSEQGTGKTLPVLVRLLELITTGQINNALIVAPKSAMGAWSRDIEKMFSEEEQEILKRYITIINYDKIWRGGNQSPYWCIWDAIILDEAHCIKNRTSKRADFLLHLAPFAKYKYILTGTPIANGHLEDFFSEFTFLYPNRISDKKIYHQQWGSYYQFLGRYAVLNQFHKPQYYIHKEELQKYVENHSYKVLKKDCLDLPEKLPDEIVFVPLAEKTLYKNLLKDSADEEHDLLLDNALAKMLRLRQLCSGHIGTDAGTVEYKNEKISYLKELLEARGDKKTVIFAEFRHSISQISKLCEEMKLPYVTLDGRQKDKFIWREFQEKEEIKVIICNYKTASAGIDLFASDTIIYYEPTIASVLSEQSKDRVHRTGQKNKCSYYYLITEGTIEEDIYNRLQQMQDFTAKFFKEEFLPNKIKKKRGKQK